MSETGLWLNYLLAGIIAALAVWLGGWKIWIATVVATAISLAIWTVASFMAGGTAADPWFGIGLFINGSFAAIFAVSCAGITRAILDNR